jgi:outer membrane receptor for ferrienterochelin and colicins
MKWCSTLLLFLLFAVPLTAQDSPEDQAEAEELSELLAVIEQETAIATKTRMNSDFVPGVVTVLEADELSALGATTVWEALSFIPGVQPVLDGEASTSVVVRGIAFPFNSGNIKIMIDSVPLSRESAGINTSLLLIPIEQVERIEFIRGPGSVVYGDFALMGLVNIITRKRGTRVDLRGDDHETWTGVAASTWGDEGGLQFTVNAGATTSDDAPVQAGREAAEERQFAILGLRGSRFSVGAQFASRDLEQTSPATGPQAAFDETDWAVSGSFTQPFGDALTASVRADVVENELRGGPSEFEGGVGRVVADLQWSGWRRQEWLFAAEYWQAEIDAASQRFPAPPGSPPGTPQVVRTVSDVSREIVAFVLQNRYDVTDRISLTAGVRFDDYSDIGSRTTPRLSAVWRPSDQHIFKAQYAEGFRPPTFFELYGPGRRIEGLDFEVNSGTELAYIFRRAGTILRTTLFRNDIDDMIFIRVPGQQIFDNFREASSKGVELEWTQELTSRMKVMANAAWFETDDNRNTTGTVVESGAAADWLGNVGLLVRPMNQLVVGAHWSHVGERPTAGAHSYDLLNLTVTRHGLFVDGLDLQLGAQNVLGEAAAYVLPRPIGDVSVRYDDDARVWLQLTWKR